MSLFGHFGNGKSAPTSWNPERSNDRFSYRIYHVNPPKKGLRGTLIVIDVVAAALLVFLIFNKYYHPLEVQAENNVLLPTVAAVQPYTTEPVASGESWGVVTAVSAKVLTEPDIDYALVSQELSHWTIVAFDKKSSNGWFMLLGGGWIQAKYIKTYDSEEQATSAVKEGRLPGVSSTPTSARP